MRGARPGGSRLLGLVALLAWALACGVKAPPRPPERAGPSGSDPGAGAGGAADGGEACGPGAPDGGAGRP